MGSYPLGRLLGLPLGSPSGEARDASLQPDLILDTMKGARGRLFCQAVSELVSGHPLMGRGPPGRNLMCLVYSFFSFLVPPPYFFFGVCLVPRFGFGFVFFKSG